MFSLQSANRLHYRASSYISPAHVKRTHMLLDEQEQRSVTKLARIIWIEAQKTAHVNPRFNKNIETICELAGRIQVKHPRIHVHDLYGLAKDAYMDADVELSAIKEKARKGHYRELLKFLMDEEF